MVIDQTTSITVNQFRESAASILDRTRTIENDGWAKRTHT
jgi:hypothetical protein